MVCVKQAGLFSETEKKTECVDSVSVRMFVSQEFKRAKRNLCRGVGIDDESNQVPKGYLVDALALRGDEGRGTLR
jgi:hypothetical protein